MRRLLCLVLALMFMLSHGSMSAAAPHAHGMAGVAHHSVADHDHEESAGAVEADHHGGAPDGSGDEGGGIAAHVHLVAGLARPFAAATPPLPTPAEPPLPLVVRLLTSREVAPLLEPPTA